MCFFVFVFPPLISQTLTLMATVKAKPVLAFFQAFVIKLFVFETGGNDCQDVISLAFEKPFFEWKVICDSGNETEKKKLTLTFHSICDLK